MSQTRRASFVPRSSLFIAMGLTAALFASGCVGRARASHSYRSTRSYSGKTAQLRVATKTGSIYVNGRYKGLAPKTMWFRPGTYNLRVRINGRNHYKTVRLYRGKRNTVYLKNRFRRAYRNYRKYLSKQPIKFKVLRSNGRVVTLNIGWIHGAKRGMKTRLKFGRHAGRRIVLTSVRKYTSKGLLY